MTAWKRAVARAFERADDYENAARIQATVADRLAATVAREPLAALPHTLEIGCGTGLLTRALRDRLALGPMIVTDIAPAMLARCRARTRPSPDLRFLAMDGERPAVAPGFDLVVSSLAAQWFVDLESALAGLSALLRPGGLLAVTTLAEGTFREWEEAQHPSAGARSMPAYLGLAALRAMHVAGSTCEVRLDLLREDHAGGAAFLQALRAIGAHTPAAPASIRSAGALRRAIRAFEASGSRVTYAVATCLIRREPFDAERSHG